MGEPESGPEERPADWAPEDYEFFESLRQDYKTAIAAFDQAVLTLSGGALGISFAFVKDIVGASGCHPWLLVTAWMLWAGSICAALISHLASANAFRAAIQEFLKDPNLSHPGARWGKVTAALNIAAAAGFVLGVVAMTVFVGINYGQ